MFDVGFPELLVIFVLALLILGPERLPRVAAQLGRWIGRARRAATDLRRQLEREVDLQDQVRRPPRRTPPPAPVDRTAQTAQGPQPARAAGDHADVAPDHRKATDAGAHEGAGTSGHTDANPPAPTAEPVEEAAAAEQPREPQERRASVRNGR